MWRSAFARFNSSQYARAAFKKFDKGPVWKFVRQSTDSAGNKADPVLKSKIVSNFLESTRTVGENAKNRYFDYLEDQISGKHRMTNPIVVLGTTLIGCFIGVKEATYAAKNGEEAVIYGSIWGIAGGFIGFLAGSHWATTAIVAVFPVSSYTWWKLTNQKAAATPN